MEQENEKEKRYKDYDYLKKVIPEKIKTLRKEREYRTQKGFAIALYNAESDQEKSRAKDKVRERDSHRVGYSIDELLKVCNLLDVDMDYILGKQEEETHEIKDLKELTGLSEEACKTVSRFLSEKTFDEKIDEYLHDKPIINASTLAKCLSWLIENGALQIINDLATMADAYWYMFENEEPPEYDFEHPNNPDNMIIVEIEKNQRALIKLIEEYSLKKR